MATKTQEVVDLLPEDGSEITHEAWREAIYSAGKGMLMQQTQKARISHLATFRNEVDDNGRITLMVSRTVAGGA